MNSLYKEICNRLYISVQEFAPLIKDTYEREYHGTYDDIDRKDMIGLAGIFKYNALTIFQRVKMYAMLDSSENIRSGEVVGTLQNFPQLRS